MKITRLLGGFLLALLLVQFSAIVGLLIASPIVEAGDRDPDRLIFFLFQILTLFLSFLTYLTSIFIMNHRRKASSQLALRSGGRPKPPYSISIYFRKDFYTGIAPGVPAWLGPVTWVTGITLLLVFILTSLIKLALMAANHPAAAVLENLNSTYNYNALVLPLAWGIMSFPHVLSLWREPSQPAATDPLPQP
jgi:hypothetical protein